MIDTSRNSRRASLRAGRAYALMVVLAPFDVLQGRETS
jgi:hypothetical protein